jgi:hypothetical protein
LKKNIATVIGFAVAPLVAVLLLGVQQGSNPVTAAGAVPIVYLYTLLAEIVFALPMFLILKRFALVRWWSAIVGGILTSIAVWSLFNWQNPSGLKDFIHMLLSGGGAGLSFWLVWRLGKSEKVPESN